MVPMHFDNQKKLESLRKTVPHLLLGVTGGIASGKTTVSLMLEEQGAPAIDFDVLSRVVVEPGKPAWKDIVAYFGEKVLLKDQTLNRKMLSQTIFASKEKRKKLEEFVHPRIFDEYAVQLQKLISQRPAEIVQAVVPLLFEAGLQTCFDKILLVYIPEEMQVERLMARDHLNRQRALEILQNQWPIDKKKGYADYIVDNSGSLPETRKQVREIWEKLKKIKKTAPS
jgi:dephospho-CoA kinase